MKNLKTFTEFINESMDEPIGVAVYVNHFEPANGDGSGWTTPVQIDVYSEDQLKSLKSQNLQGFKFFRKTRGGSPIVFRYTQELQKTIK
jgi:hypothetical protein